MLKTVWDITNAEFVQIVQTSHNYSEILSKCGYTNLGNTLTIKKRINALNLSVDHFRPTSNFGPAKKLPLSEILVENSTYCSNTALKKRLIDECDWVYKCNECDISTWNDKPLSLELDHINGNNKDNRITNLRLLCPNCHSQTSTFRGKNKGKIESNRCRDCDTTINNVSRYCVKCMYAHRGKGTKTKLSLSELESDLKELKTYEAVGCKHNLSENCIRKWFRQYNQEGSTNIVESVLDADALAILALDA